MLPILTLRREPHKLLRKVIAVFFFFKKTVAKSGNRKMSTRKQVLVKMNETRVVLPRIMNSAKEKNEAVINAAPNAPFKPGKENSEACDFSNVSILISFPLRK